MTLRSMSRVVLQHLQEIRQRLWNQDPSLDTVSLWPDTPPRKMSSTYISMLLEETKIQKALQDCLQAAAASPVVTALRLGNLPEPDLEAALLTLAKRGAASLRELYVGPLNASSSISAKVLTKLLQTMAGSRLEILDCPCRIRLLNQASVQALAQAVGQLPHLQRLRLHVVPRTSIEMPTVRLDSLLKLPCALETLEIVAGYPEHNPYQKPVVRSKTMAQLFERNPNIRLLALANLGLMARHVQALFQGPAWPSQLEHLSLPYHPRLSSNHPWSQALAEKLSHSQHTTLQAVLVPRPCLAVAVWTTLNRHGRDQLIQASQGSTEHEAAWQELMLAAHEESDERLKLNLDWTLIRSNPMLAVQTFSATT